MLINKVIQFNKMREESTIEWTVDSPKIFKQNRQWKNSKFCVQKVSEQFAKFRHRLEKLFFKLGLAEGAFGLKNAPS